jgi:hypothetical protein
MDGITDIKDIIDLIITVYIQFSETLKRLYSYIPKSNDLSNETVKIIEMYDNFKSTLGYKSSEGLGDNNDIENSIKTHLLPELREATDEELTEIFYECRELARKYDLQVKEQMNRMIELTALVEEQPDPPILVKDSFGNIVGGIQVVEYTLITGGVKIRLEFFTIETLDITSFNWFQTYNTNLPINGKEPQDIDKPDNSDKFIFNPEAINRLMNTDHHNFFFYDDPSRNMKKEEYKNVGEVYFYLELSLVGKRQDGTWEILYTFTYGFEIPADTYVATPLPLIRGSNPSEFHVRKFNEP